MRVLRHGLGAIFVLIAQVALSAGSARAVIIDFESLRSEVNAEVFVGSSYAEDGFTISSDALQSFGTLLTRFTGSTTLFSIIDDGLITLTKNGGGPFSISSVDLAELNIPAIADVTFTGNFVAGGTTVQTFTLDGFAFGVETFLFNDSFTNLASLEWIQEDPFHQFDNLVVTEIRDATALPAASPLFAGGLALLGLIGWRKRKMRRDDGANSSR